MFKFSGMYGVLILISFSAGVFYGMHTSPKSPRSYVKLIAESEVVKPEYLTLEYDKSFLKVCAQLLKTKANHSYSIQFNNQKTSTAIPENTSIHSPDEDNMPITICDRLHVNNDKGCALQINSRPLMEPT